jgi:hypothetical protein
MSGPSKPNPSQWRDPTAPGAFEAVETRPAAAPSTVAWEIPDIDRDLRPDLAQPDGAEAEAVATSGTTRISARRATPSPRTASITRARRRMGQTLRLSAAGGAGGGGEPTGRRIGVAIEVIAFVLLTVTVLIVYAVNARSRLPDQLKLAVNSYYYGVQDGYPLRALTAYICPVERSSWVQAQQNLSGDTRRGITDHDIGHGARTATGWNVRVHLKLIDGTKETAQLDVIEMDDSYLICGGTNSE